MDVIKKHVRNMALHWLLVVGPVVYDDFYYSEDSLYIDAWDLSMNDYMDYYFMNNVPSSTLEYNRYIAHHRLDIKINKQFRIGLYEQVIFGGRDIPFYYIIPVLPFWSSQHEGGDLDNLMIGVDFDYIFGQKNNRSII